jgi:hypothetical protein
VAKAAAIKLRQTSSIGWAAYPWNPGEPAAVPLEAVLGLADQGLYAAKSLGKIERLGFCPTTREKKYCSPPLATEFLPTAWKPFASRAPLSHPGQCL